MYIVHDSFSIASHACSAQMRACGLLLQTSHVAWSVCLSVYVLDTRVSCAKTTKPIQMPFGGGLMWVQGTMY